MPGYRLGTCLGCPEDACELSIFLLCSLVCYRPLASILSLYLSACCNHQDLRRQSTCAKSFIVLRRRTAVFSRANLEHTASAQPVHNFTLIDYARTAAQSLVKLHLRNCIDCARIAGQPYITPEQPH